MALRIGIDVGGTFTDVTAFDDARNKIVLIAKYDSSPRDPMSVMRRICADLVAGFDRESIALILHGSTAALNTLLEGKGVRVGLITSAGFRDVYEIGRQWRGDDVFNLFAPAPKMLTTRDLIREAGGRLDARGQEIEPLSAGDVEAAARDLSERGCEAIAVCFLHAFANPRHEQAAADIIRRAAPGVYVSVSSEVNPEWREYERTATTVANAYIGPPVSRYLHSLDQLARESFADPRTLMMKSDGGAASARMLHAMPVQTVMSGPVAGVIGSRFLGDAKAITNLITFDTGGTSSDMAVLPGPPLFRSEVSIGRHPVRTHTVDIETIGAGGGSIASIQLGGILKVGPESAGANPGPACYGRGGTHPTLTDALVVLGHLNGETLLEGDLAVSTKAAESAVANHIAHPLGMTVTEAAQGIVDVLLANCVLAMRNITVERGYDPREFTLIPFGGMGPTIATRIAAELGISRILVPRDPGIFSAWGMLVTDIHDDRSITHLTRLDATSVAELESIFAPMQAAAVGDLLSENVPRERIRTVRTAGMRYRGQSYEVMVEVPPLDGPSDIEILARRFHDAHQRRYGHMAQEEAIEIVNFKVTGIGMIAKPQLARLSSSPGMASDPVSRRNIWFSGTLERNVPVYNRNRMPSAMRIEGPAVVEEKTSTTVIHHAQTAEVDEFGNLEITV